ncbi:MAG: hypothetical protein KUF72_10980 [Candidatus Thiodiazotropha sp. (ex Ctena orbiculata)]|nr:hypothetical protein [Candidatus Thiodiazotropha taylori]
MKSVLDFTAKCAHLPFNFLEEVSRRIINEVSGISLVAHDIFSTLSSTTE